MSWTKSIQNPKKLSYEITTNTSQIEAGIDWVVHYVFSAFGGILKWVDCKGISIHLDFEFAKEGQLKFVMLWKCICTFFTWGIDGCFGAWASDSVCTEPRVYTCTAQSHDVDSEFPSLFNFLNGPCRYQLLLEWKLLRHSEAPA